MGTCIEVSYDEKCPECGASSLDHDNERGEVVCSVCGFVLSSSNIDQGPEWTGFDSEQIAKKARAGPALSKWQKEFAPSTDIGWRDVDSYGRSIPENNRAQVYRLRKWQRRLRTFRTSQRNVLKGFMQIERGAQQLDIPPKVREEAQRIFKMASEKNMIQGRGIECVSAASIYTACRIFNVPRTLNEISDGLHVPRKEIGRAYRNIARGLDLTLCITDPRDYLSRFCSRLQLNEKTLECAIEIIAGADSIGYISGKDPSGVAASAIYIATMMTGQIRTQSEISKAAGITEVTIRKRYKEMIDRLKIKITNSHLERFNYRS